MKCRWCGGELYGGKGDYWHVQPTGTLRDWMMRCPDGLHLGEPEPETEIVRQVRKPSSTRMNFGKHSGTRALRSQITLEAGSARDRRYLHPLIASPTVFGQIPANRKPDRFRPNIGESRFGESDES